MKLILASRSPRRLELLAAIGITPEVRAVDIDESPAPGESVRDTVTRLAASKALAVRAAGDEEAVVLGADTLVAVAGVVLAKPLDAADHRRMLRQLSGRRHEVHTAVALRRLPDGEVRFGSARSEVEMHALSEREITWYVATLEGSDKAGGYAIQGRAAVFVRGLSGSYANVVGLPVDLVYRLLVELGVAERVAGVSP